MDTKIEPNPRGKIFLRVGGILMTVFGGVTISYGLFWFLAICVECFEEGFYVDDYFITSFLMVGGVIVLMYLFSGSIISLIAGIIGIVNSKKTGHSTRCMVWGIIALAVLAIEYFGIFLIMVMSGKTGADFPLGILFFSSAFCLGAPVLYIIGAILNKKSYNQIKPVK